MVGDPWPEEPADPFPGNTDPFPAYSEPVVVPGERTRRPGPTAGEPTSDGVEPAVQSGLLALTAVFRIGLFALALGPMLVVFRGDGYWGQVVTAVGVATCAYGVHRYLVYRRVLQSAGQIDGGADEPDREESRGRGGGPGTGPG